MLWSDVATRIPALLEEMQAGMLAKAGERLSGCTEHVSARLRWAEQATLCAG